MLIKGRPTSAIQEPERASCRAIYAKRVTDRRDLKVKHACLRRP
jgi:hypothetical protein